VITGVWISEKAGIFDRIDFKKIQATLSALSI
jgi:hypothetical protein